MKTDQEILDELKQASGGEQKRSFGLTAFIILLAIIIGAFTWFNRQSDDEPEEETSSPAVTEAVEADVDEDVDTEQASDALDNSDKDATSVNDAAEVIEGSGEAEGELPTEGSTHSDTDFTEVAQVGEGVTHLARRATAAYLSTNNISDLKATQKIFIEDYLVKNTGAVSLEISNSRTFQSDVIEQAITQARALTDAQLTNLEQYSRLVPNL